MAQVLEVQENPDAPECCRKDDALFTDESEARPDLTCYRCRTCNRRHFVLDVDKGRLGVTGAQVGG